MPTEATTYRVTMTKGTAQRRYIGVRAQSADLAAKTAVAGVHDFGWLVSSVAVEANRPVNMIQPGA